MKSAALALPHQRLRPVTTHSSPSRTARVETPARSEPASGSDSAIAPIQSPRALRAEQLVPAVGVGHRRPQALGAGQDAGRRHPGAGQLLADHAVLEDAEPEAAVLGGHGDAEVAELRQPATAGTPGSRPSAGRARWRPAAPRPSRTGGPAPAAPPAPGVCHGGSSTGGSGCQVSFSLDVIVGRSPRRAGMITYTLAAGGAPRTPSSSVQVSSLTGEDRPGEHARHRRPRPPRPHRPGPGRVATSTGNPDVVVTDVELLASGWHVLRRTTLDRRRSDGEWVTEQRETYDRGNGATMLLLRRRAAHGPAHPAVPVPGLRQRPPGRPPARGRRRAARRRRPGGRRPPRGRGGARGRRRRGASTCSTSS